MNNYMKNYGIWLGGLLALSFILSYFIYIPLLSYLAIIAGTIIGTVQTHNSEGDRIKFGKAVGIVTLLIAGFQILGLIISVVQYGTDYLNFMLTFFITNLFISVMMGVSILLAVGTWYMFEKAGKPGWAMLIPVYNVIVMCQIAQKPMWWIAMLFIPIVNIVFLIMILNGISKSFGKDAGFTVGLVFLQQIFFAILGFGPAEYQLAQVQNNDNNNVLDN